MKIINLKMDVSKRKRGLRKMKHILKNMAKCRKCGDLIESKSRTKIVRCSCGSIYVEGGKYYIKRGGNLEDIIELSEYEEK